ncbi:MAG: lipoprotein-releasing system ATP-binding protein LolD [Bacteroidetes bacterium]|nr:MAG: lipoprotein-releasing system ATP-binding protein LolD [Bacteroidota bacterium]
MIRAQNIHKAFGSLQVLKGVNLIISQGEIVSIVGASGSGKSTLLQILGTIEKQDQGSVIIEESDVSSLNDKALSKFRNQKIGFVFQFHHLLPEFTALENICIPAFIAGKNRNEAEKEANLLLKMMGIAARASHKPNELSGGEQQRVAIARALINKPTVILADEPSGNLDAESSEGLHQLFFKLRKELGQTFVIVTHNRELAAMADRKMTIRDGVVFSENN